VECLRDGVGCVDDDDDRSEFQFCTSTTECFDWSKNLLSLAFVNKQNKADGDLNWLAARGCEKGVFLRASTNGNWSHALQRQTVSLGRQLSKTDRHTNRWTRFSFSLGRAF
jgi:hypothetical protein